MKTLSLAVMALLPACAAPPEGEALSFGEEVRSVVVDIESGRLNLRGGDARGATVVAQPRVEGGQLDLEAAVHDGTLWITSDCAPTFGSCDHELAVVVPQGATIVANVDTGDVRIQHVRGQIDASVTTGNVDLLGVRGDLDIGVGTGSVVGVSLETDLTHVEITTGHVSLQFISVVEEISAVTTTGNVALAVSDGMYDVSAGASNGAVTIDVDQSVHADQKIYARTQTGSVHIGY